MEKRKRKPNEKEGQEVRRERIRYGNHPVKAVCINPVLPYHTHPSCFSSQREQAGQGLSMANRGAASQPEHPDITVLTPVAGWTA